jgi:hypothetical protein
VPKINHKADFGNGGANTEHERYAGFYEYYQIHTGDEDNSPETGAKGAEELRAVGLHSLWGMLHTIIKELNMTWDEVMWQRSWINIQMMLADSARMTKAPIVKKLSGKELATMHKLKEHG